MKYKLRYEHPNSQYIPIEAEFDIDDKESIELTFPAWRPGRYELGDFAKNIHGFKVLDENNKALKNSKISKNKWLVDCSGRKKLKVSYKYYGAELNAGSTYMDDLQLYVNPVNCLVYIEEKQGEACTLSLEIPDNFEIACGAKVKGNTIKTASYHELVDSPFIASANLQHEKFNCGNVDFHIWFQGELEVDWTRVIGDLKKYTISQIEKFEGFPVKEYHYLYQILNIKAYHGVEHQTSTVISLGPNTEFYDVLYDEFLGVSSHELYHTWNVKALRPIEMFPYNYSKENYTHLGYVAEGVTTYMGDLFLCESGVKDFDWYRTELEKLLQRHFDNFGRFNYSVAESSWDTWLDGYVPGAPNRKVSIYNEGALLTFVLDAMIRYHSENKSSMHDVMKNLYEDFSSTGYSALDYRTMIEKYLGSDMNDFFENYFYGTHSFEPILVEALEFLGLEIKMEKNPKTSHDLLGVKFMKSGDDIVVHSIYPGGTGDLAGIMVGDKLLAVCAEKIEKTLDELLDKHKEGEIELKISRLGRELILKCPNTNKSYYPIYKIVKKKSTSNLSKRIFKKWCGYQWDSIN